MNADGFGVGWYADGDPVPARYRRAGADLGRRVASPTWPGSPAPGRCWPRSARPRTARPGRGRRRAVRRGPLAVQPQRHAGRLARRATAGLAATLPAADLLALEARVDSALVWALVLARLRAGAARPTRWPARSRDLAAHGITGRFNFLLTDGEAIAATAAGDTLCYRRRPRPGRGRLRARRRRARLDRGARRSAARGHRRRGVDGHARSAPGTAAPTQPDAGRPRPARRPANGRRDPSMMTAAACRAAACPTASWPSALRADARAGLTAVAEDAAAQVVLRRAGQRAVREDHPAAASTTRPGPSGPSWPPWPREIAAATGASTLVELGSGAVGQDPAAARRAARGGHAAQLRAGGRQRDARWSRPRTGCWPATRA